MAPQVEKLPVPIVVLGEGPHYDSSRQTLYYVDIRSKNIHRYDYATKEHAQSLPLGSHGAHFIIPLVGHKDLFAAAVGRFVQVIRWDGQNNTSVELLQVIAELETETPKNFINDGKVGPDGRLYTGTIGMGDTPGTTSEFFKKTGSFYRISQIGVVTKIDTGIKISNGIAFDQKKNAVYYIDSYGEGLMRYDLDFAPGKPTNKKSILTYKEKFKFGNPDGMTIDTNGNLYVAAFYASKVWKINPDTGNIVEEIEIPAKEIASCTFGGPNLDILFVTTGKLDDKDGGGTYAVTGLGERGYENLPFNYMA